MDFVWFSCILWGGIEMLFVAALADEHHSMDKYRLYLFVLDDKLLNLQKLIEQNKIDVVVD